MKNKKSKIGKIVLLTAAMAVTVPTAFALSACGAHEAAADSWRSNDEMHWHLCRGHWQDEHTYDLGYHDWVVGANDYLQCSVCGHGSWVTLNDSRIVAMKGAWEKTNHSNAFTYESYDEAKGETTFISYKATGEGTIWTRTEKNGTAEDQVILKVYKNADGEYIAYDKYNGAAKNPYYKVDEHYFAEHERYTNLLGEYNIDPNMGAFDGADLGRLFHGIREGIWQSQVEHNFRTNAYDAWKSGYWSVDGVTTEEKDGVLTVAIDLYKWDISGRVAMTVAMTWENGTLSISAESDSTFARQSITYETVAVAEPSAEEITELSPKVEFSVSVMKDGQPVDGNFNFTVDVAYGTAINSIDDYLDQLKAWIAEKIDGVTVDMIEITDYGRNPYGFATTWDQMPMYSYIATITTQGDGE